WVSPVTGLLRRGGAGAGLGGWVGSSERVGAEFQPEVLAELGGGRQRQGAAPAQKPGKLTPADPRPPAQFVQRPNTVADRLLQLGHKWRGLLLRQPRPPIRADTHSIVALSRLMSRSIACLDI